MKINLTKREYRTLLDIIFIAEWAISAHDTKNAEEHPEISELAQKLFSHAKEMGAGAFVKYYKEIDEYAVSRKFEDETAAFDIVRRYEDLSFWETLIDRLTERDVLVESAKDEIGELGFEKFYELAEPIEARYIAEFEEHGLRRLVINAT